MLIAFHGAAESGKDTCAQILCERYGFQRTAFADPLKAAVRIKFGLSEWHTDTTDGKRTFIPEFGLTVRQILQLEGTEATKPVFGNDFWIRRWAMTLDALTDRGFNLVTLTDLRFDEEAEEVLNRGGYVIHLIRPQHDNHIGTCHASEKGIDKSYIDFTVINDGTLEDLQKQLDMIVNLVSAEEADHDL